MKSTSYENKDDIPVAPLSFDEIDQIINEWSQISAVDSQYEETESTVRFGDVFLSLRIRIDSVCRAQRDCSATGF